MAATDQSDNICVICQQPLVDDDGSVVEALPCAHAYHEECLKNYAEIKGLPKEDIPCAKCNLVPSASEIAGPAVWTCVMGHAEHELLGSKDEVAAEESAAPEDDEAATTVVEVVKNAKRKTTAMAAATLRARLGTSSTRVERLRGANA